MEQAATTVVARLREAGHTAYFVGGCVRDRLLALPVKDIDIASSARPEEVARLFEDVRFVGASFGVSLVRVEGFCFEVTTFRRDGRYLDHRHPESVSYGTIEDDAARRDFTVNALYHDPLEDQTIDLVGGVEDLNAKVLRAVGEPTKRFREDALRLLRAIRFATRLGFEVEKQTWSALCDQAPTIQFVSAERQRDELTAMLSGPSPVRAIALLDRSNLLHWLLPEIEAMKGVEQGKQYHPEGDVFVHTCLVLEKLEPRTPETAWAALLHDVGKPPTADTSRGKFTFYDHDKVGATMAVEILSRLRFSNDFIEHVSDVVRRHMMFKNITDMRQSTLRRFLAAPTIETDLAVHRADCLGSHGMLSNWEYANSAIKKLGEQSTPKLPDPLLRGDDLLAMGMKPGPALGDLLREAMDLQLEGEFADREHALAWALKRVRETS